MTEPTPRSFQEMVDEEEHGEYAWLLPGIPSLSGEHIVELCRAIVTDHAAQCIDGVLVDVLTASAILKLADTLNAKNRENFLAMRSVTRMGHVAQKVCF
jgi:hypothetical protein